ncbi:MAG: P-II family nitrogen regulator [Clostridia bacterium]|nr:P-II family nitrogen regulator [Clostridia bacterium]
MLVKQDMSLIITIVNKGFSDPVISTAKGAGAEGATIISARGTGTHEEEKVLGVAIQPEKEMVLILVPKVIRKKVMRDICKSCSLTDEGRGMTFSIPVDEAGGIVHLMGDQNKFSVLHHGIENKKRKVETRISPKVYHESNEDEGAKFVQTDSKSE